MPANRDMFYPILLRRETYKKTVKGAYYTDYHEYYDEIEEDCKNRCVYCDATSREIGGEGMQLDHFRPKSIPEFNHLISDPNNLLLSCPKCNRLKSNHWPADVSSVGSHSDGCGFVDPFENNRNDYYELNSSGEIKEKLPPAKYTIKLLKLNRVARKQVRRKRFIDAEIERIGIKLQNKISEINDMFDAGYTKAEIKEKFTVLSELFDMQRQFQTVRK